MSFLSHSTQDTFNYGTHFAKQLSGGEIIGLTGELGSGKTTFVQGLARGLGIETRVISPTFVLMRSYRGHTFDLYHIDLYRLDELREIESLGLNEIWLKPKNIVVVEWAEKVLNELPKTTIFLHFKYESENERLIQRV